MVLTMDGQTEVAEMALVGSCESFIDKQHLERRDKGVRAVDGSHLYVDLLTTALK